MSLASLERAIRLELQEVLSNPKIRNSDFLEWSRGEVELRLSEISVRLPRLGVNVAIDRKHDKRVTP